MRKEKKRELKQNFLQNLKKKTTHKNNKGRSHLLNKVLNAKQTESEIG